ncbi:efflux RND transporter periplasmic adaptor subunit [Sphingomonas sp. H39-1-10]|uniref:efflux RND transporter periplasmic adaptor subunit n=1 Tax=Sphingomonas pollutisoli TaxID=3030829 RepID=UPI0023B943B6|nr:efflux RND transporter periplasmic adaptor subunit [Sphingomonas pollutisoli]MDF0488949.1 efflux RND transporter periplasmic adaptor subunit [Sphingomonas pollutisoli]
MTPPHPCRAFSSSFTLAPVIALLCTAALTGCSGSGGAGAAGGKRGNAGPPQVGYVVAKVSSVPLVTELAGRTSAFESSDVRPQVSGVIYRRFFTEGALVRKGQPLYQIDPSLYRASANQARANLLSAQATAASTRIKADRYKPLAEIEAVAKQDYTDADAAAKQASAAVAQQRAALETANINLRFTTVPAPITGRIGRSLYTVGTLVTSGQADALATIQRLDPIFVDIQQSSADLLRLRRALASGGEVPASAAVTLKLEDGSDYGMTGKVQFSEVVVDQTTGTVTLRAVFPNPKGLLLPGMFVRASFAQSIDNTAILIPQQAVSRTAKGDATVFVLNGDKAVLRTITATRTVGTDWVVTAGLKPGEKVITEGVGKTKPGITVMPVPAGSPQKIQAPQKPGQKG